MDFTPHTDSDLSAMLDVLGLPDVDSLFDNVPEDLRAPVDLGIAPGRSEADVADRLTALAARTTSLDQGVCFLGGGVYDHYSPAVVGAITGRGEFATAYTPYQPEMSQGELQALFEFQTLAAEVLGLPVANSSLYDGATAIVEGVVLCLGAVRKRSRVVIAGDLDPRYRETLATYLPGLGAELVEVPADPAAVMEVAGEAAVVVAQHPDFSGRLTDVPALAEAAHDAGAKLLVSFDLLLAGVLAPPGRLGADVVTADGLSAGNTLSYGGPGCGLLACRAEDVRRLPGRLVGQTVDADGNRAFVLTLQAREQHIRREKATSNICTNQSLNALAVAVYLSWLGPQGLVALGEACLAGAAYARERLQASGIELADPDAAVGKEFAVRVSDPARTAAALAERGYLVGPVAGEDRLLVAVTEQRTRDEIDALAKAFAEVAGESGR